MTKTEGTGKGPRAGTLGEWARLHLWEIQPVRDVLLFLAILGVVWIGYRISIVTVPLMLALALAYLFEPLVRRFAKGSRVRRRIAAGGLIFAVLVLVVVPAVLGLIWAVTSGFSVATNFQQRLVTMRRIVYQQAPPSQEELDTLGSELWQDMALMLREPRAQDAPQPENAQPPNTPPTPAVDPISASANSQSPVASDDHTGESAEPAPLGPPAPREGITSMRGLVKAGAEYLWYWAEHNEQWLKENAPKKGLVALRFFASGAKTLGFIAFGGFLTAFFFFFVCTGYQRVLSALGEMIPDKARPQTMHLLTRMDRVVAGFVRGRLTICVILSVLFTIGYTLIGAPLPLVLGVATGMLSIVPYLAIVTIPVTILLMFIGPSAGIRGEWWWIMGAPIVLYYTVQSLDDYVLNPMIQGKHTDMDTPSILFASIGGAALLGIYGLLIAIPLAACIKILWLEVAMPRIQAWKRGQTSDPLPIGGAAAPSKSG